MAVQSRRKLTYDDLQAFPDDGLRRELIDGELYVTAAPNTRHQEIVGRLFASFYNYLEEHGGGRIFVAPYDVVFAQSDVVEPDLVFVSDAHDAIITPANAQGAPTLLIEVVSNPRTDLVIKRARYAKFGVPEYCVVDSDADRVEVYVLGDKGYSKPTILEVGETLVPGPLPGLRIDLAWLFHR